MRSSTIGGIPPIWIFQCCTKVWDNFSSFLGHFLLFGWTNPCLMPIYKKLKKKKKKKWFWIPVESWGMRLSYIHDVHVVIVNHAYATDIERRSQNSYTALCNGDVSHGAPIGGIWFCRPNTWKQTQTKCVPNLHAPCGISCVFIFTRRPQYIYTWWITLILIMGNPEDPQFEPMLG